MNPYLLDTNVLLALAWPNHVHHSEAMGWFARIGSAAFRTCPITETGFVRISSNPVFTASAVTPAEGISLLGKVTRLPGWGFWPDDLRLETAFPASHVIATHRQVTDGYLLALAKAHGGMVATLDRGMAAAAAAANDAGRVELVLLH